MRLLLLRGLLGWSNTRTGLELYRWDPKENPRWDERKGGEKDAGVLLHDGWRRSPDEQAKMEGCPVIVVVLDRRASENEIVQVEQQIREIEVVASE